MTNITNDPAFCDRWTSMTSPEYAVKTRYVFEAITILKARITRIIGSPEAHISSMTYQYASGIQNDLKTMRPIFLPK